MVLKEKIRDEVVRININDLKQYKKNNKDHPEDQISLLVSNIDKFGFTTPLLIDAKNCIIAGHGRYEAAKRLNFSEIPCIKIEDLTQAEIKSLRISDNKIAEMGEINWENLKDEFFDLKDSGEGLEFLTGYNESDFNDLDDAEGQDDNFNPPEDIETNIKQGDIIKLGNHKLMCGDSLKDYDHLIQGNNSIDLVVTDPPYNVDYEGSNGLKIQNDSMADEAFYNLLDAAMEVYNLVLKPGSSIYMFHADIEGVNFRKAFQKHFKLSSVCIWMKPSLVLGRSDYHWQHESILYGWKEGEKHNWYSDRAQTSIWQFEKTHHNKEHPTMKPIPLISYPIQNSSKQGDIVLDLFGGSGSTLIACEQLNRICYMMELDEKYCEVICQRWEKLTGKTREVLQ